MSAAVHPEEKGPAPKRLVAPRWTITLTFGEQAVNRAKDADKKKLAPAGFQVPELWAVAEAYAEAHGAGAAEVYELNIPELPTAEPAAVLVLRGGVDALLGPGGAERLYVEQRAQNVDKREQMYKKVVTLRARWKLLYDEAGAEPDYEAGRGRVVAFESVPELQALREALPALLGPLAGGLRGEGNFYFSPRGTIGFHGDTERKIVVAARLGAAASLPLHYQWYSGGAAVGARRTIQLRAGDIYVMSEKATGYDWRRHKAADGGPLATLRHAAGTPAALKL